MLPTKSFARILLTISLVCLILMVPLIIPPPMVAKAMGVTVTDCGTDPTVSGNESVGIITVGTGILVTSCIVVFDETLNYDVACFFTPQTTITPVSGMATRDEITINLGANFGGGTLVYFCTGL